MDLESFYPAAERFQLAMRLNQLAAAPGFRVWTARRGARHQPAALSSAGKPRVSVISISHLDDRERMFFVTLLLNEVVGWMRRQPGTSSLRAIIYIDEVFGFLPPVANPPRKRAAAHPAQTGARVRRRDGAGDTGSRRSRLQGLANAGTWFVGRLQTERDKARLLDGLLSAAGGERLARRHRRRRSPSLDKRMFLLHNVHDERVDVFATRWA